jgi:hypothetical protein
MFIIRDIFQLTFGHYADAKKLLDDAMNRNLMPANSQHNRVLTDFTGDSYRLIFEEGFPTLADYEKNLTEGMSGAEWKAWYAQFKEHVTASHREILRLIG